jgi:hypothetical protein
VKESGCNGMLESIGRSNDRESRFSSFALSLSQRSVLAVAMRSDILSDVSIARFVNGWQPVVGPGSRHDCRPQFFVVANAMAQDAMTLGKCQETGLQHKRTKQMFESGTRLTQGSCQ